MIRQYTQLAAAIGAATILTSCVTTPREDGSAGRTLRTVVFRYGEAEIEHHAVHAEKEVIERSPNVTSVRRVTDFADTRNIGGYSLSPDGKSVVLQILEKERIQQRSQYGNRTWYTDEWLSNLWIANTEGVGGLQRLTHGKWMDLSPSYSPTGGQVYFSSNRAGTPNIWRLSTTAEGGLVMVTSSQTSDINPVVSPDGKTLMYNAYMSNSKIPQIWTKPVEKGLPMQIREGQDAVWSPDGKRIMFSAQERSTGAFKIWTMGPNGETPTLISSDQDCNDIHPCWFADGQHFAFASDRGKSSRGHNYDIWMADLDGSNLRQLTTNGSRDDMPVVARDGKTIYFRSNRGIKWDIWMMEIAEQPKEAQ